MSPILLSSAAASLLFILKASTTHAALVRDTSGCGISHNTGYHNNNGAGFSIQSGGHPRTYTINIPSSYQEDNQTPLIVSYHGNGGNSDTQFALSEFGNETYNPHMISVFPQGSHGHWQGASYADAGIDDLLFTSDLLAHLQSSYCIDSSRIYANGKSVGGGFTDLLACSLTGNHFAAFAICMSSAIPL
jgi:poly(3-hydroxybutyrate) depolymerase